MNALNQSKNLSGALEELSALIAHHEARLLEMKGAANTLCELTGRPTLFFPDGKRNPGSFISSLADNEGPNGELPPVRKPLAKKAKKKKARAERCSALQPPQGKQMTGERARVIAGMEGMEAITTAGLVERWAKLGKDRMWFGNCITVAKAKGLIKGTGNHGEYRWSASGPAAVSASKRSKASEAAPPAPAKSPTFKFGKADPANGKAAAAKPKAEPPAAPPTPALVPGQRLKRNGNGCEGDLPLMRRAIALMPETFTRIDLDAVLPAELSGPQIGAVMMELRRNEEIAFAPTSSGDGPQKYQRGPKARP